MKKENAVGYLRTLVSGIKLDAHNVNNPLLSAGHPGKLQ